VPELDAELLSRVLAGDRTALARAITAVESRRAEHRGPARALVEAILPHTGRAVRVGVSGAPGVGKSTFIEAVGLRLADRGRRVAVLAIDPSSRITGGSILGDKTRMTELSRHPSAFIRPSPSGGALGGVAHRTYEAMLLCEAAGFDTILIESVGVGQSETILADLVDLFLLLVLPNGGDELQGLKRGIVEVADLVAVHKADGESLPMAKTAQAEYTAALRVLRHDGPSVILTSRDGLGLDEVLEAIDRAGVSGERRRRQLAAWTRRLAEERVLEAFHESDAGRALEASIAEGRSTPSAMAEDAVARFLSR
jgi:LAO/AO transport system kinase